MTDTTQATNRPGTTAADADEVAAEETADQTADAETSAEARTQAASTPSATTVDEMERGSAQPSGGVADAAATTAPAGSAAAGPTPGSSAVRAANGKETALFDAAATKDLQGRWQVIQVAFVDEPKGAVEQADQLVDEVLTRLQESFARERQELEQAWSGGSEASTEDLRQAIRRYRSFFNRLLSI